MKPCSRHASAMEVAHARFAGVGSSPITHPPHSPTKGVRSTVGMEDVIADGEDADESDDSSRTRVPRLFIRRHYSVALTTSCT